MSDVDRGSPPPYALADPELLARLSTPGAYPYDPSAAEGVEVIQTHLSHVFLTRERVYKFRKPVDLAFVRFVTLAERDADCLREIALNRRLAPDVYLGVAPLEHGADLARVGVAGEVLAGPPGAGPEHCVVMRRLPSGRDALSLLARDALRPAQLDRVAVRIARFHEAQRLGVPAPFRPDAWRRRCTAPAEGNLELLAEHAAALGLETSLDRCARRTRAFLAGAEARFERRRRDGRAVDGHGDLHLQHVWFERDDAEPIAIDCIEFDEALRQIDAAAEIAFPVMDLTYRGRPDLGERLLRIYAREADDYGLYDVVDYFASYRAAVRAKVAALAAVDAGIRAEQREHAADSARRHLMLAGEMLSPRAPGPIVLVGGVVGTGKTSVCEVLAERADAAGGAAVVSADRVRKRLAGLALEARSDAGRDRGLYAPAQKRRTYAAVLERAEPIARSGRAALLDATWSRREDRDAAAELARRIGAPLHFVETVCAESVALERLARRAAAGRDASDAGPDLYPHSRSDFEPLAPDERAHPLRIATDDPAWREELSRIVSWLGGAGR